MSCRFIRWASLMLLSCATPCAAFGQTASKQDATRIIGELLKRDENLSALSLEYREIERAAPIPRTPGEHLRRVVAARAPDLFMRDNAHGHDQLNFTDDPFRKTLIVGPNGWQLLSHVNRWLEEGPPSVGSRPPEDPAGELIFRALCWWPYVRWSPPDIHGRSISMRVLLQDERYALRNATDVVDGRKCLVLEVPNVDVFWLDAEQPSRVLRRDVYNTETGSLGARFELSEYTQYQQNVWLPGRIRNAQFDSYAHTPTLRQRRVVDATFSVRNIEINDDVDDRMFHMELPPGTVQDAAAEEQRYLKPMSDGQSDHLASIVKWGKQFYATDEMAGGGYRDVCMSGAGVVVGFSVCWLVLSITGGRAGREHTRP